MEKYTSDVSLRIKHPSIDALEISKQLELSATTSWSVGASRITPAGRDLEGYYDETYFTYKLPNNDGVSIPKLITNFNKILVSKIDFLNELRLSGGHIEYFIGWYLNENAGEIFVCELLRELSDMGVSLSFDMYI